MPDATLYSWLSWIRQNTHAYQPCCASLRSEEVVIGKKCPMEYFVDGCHGNNGIHITQSFISMCTIVDGCHGNQLNVMGVMYYVCVLSFIPICITIQPVIMISKKHCLRLCC